MVPVKVLVIIVFQFEQTNPHTMKRKLLFIAVAAVAALASCRQSESSKDTVVTDSTSDITAENTLDSPDSIKTFFSESFPVEIANAEIEALLADTRIQRLASDTALGGTFHNKDDFFKSQDATLTDGVMLWYNIERHGQQMVLALAAERMNLEDAMTPGVVPTKPTLNYPDELFRFDLNVPFDIREEKHSNFFRVSPTMVPNQRVVKGKKDFEKLIVKKKTKKGVVFNKTAGLYFQNNCDKEHPNGLLSSLVDQPDAVGIRYYLAYDDNAPHDKIRVILVAVDKNYEKFAAWQSS
jgi:hypothetical protein